MEYKLYLVEIVDCLGQWIPKYIAFSLATARCGVRKLNEKYGGSTMCSIYIYEFKVDPLLEIEHWSYRMNIPYYKKKLIEVYSQRNGKYELNTGFEIKKLKKQLEQLENES